MSNEAMEKLFRLRAVTARWETKALKQLLRHQVWQRHGETRMFLENHSRQLAGTGNKSLLGGLELDAHVPKNINFVK